MTIAVGRVTKEENDLFDIMDDWLRRDRFVFYLWGHNQGRAKSTNFI